ncbi:MAG: hypothetical protein EXS15_05485 [Phycisphaerales bacterium]|nr:hypothetical protein [Phycisphaerales bacterium]
MLTTRRIAAVAATIAMALPASAQVRVLNYNYAHLGGDAASLQAVISAAHADNKTGWAKPVDILCFQEVTAATVGTLQDIVNGAAPAGATYARATWTTSSNEDAAAGAQCAFYRVQTISETTASHADIYTGAGRFGDRWLFRLNGYSSAAASFYVYSAHLKASPGFESDRETGALALRSNSNAIGASVRAIYVGDFNIYVNTEPAYLAFLATGNGRGNDPFGSGTWAGSSNAWKHTQSPRLTSGTLVGGGMDDRFDFHLMTDQMIDAEGISFIPGTYRAFGNDGNHYNIAINTGANLYYPTERARSNALANALFAATDHIPVIVDYQVPAVMSASMGALPARVIQGAQVAAVVSVQNIASVLAASGSDELDYTVTGSVGLAGAASGIAPLAPASATANLTLSTGVAGVLNTQATVTTSSEGAQNTLIVVQGQCTVLSRARPSWQSASITATTSVPVTIAQGGAAVDVDLLVHNFGWTTLQSKLDGDYVALPAGSAVSVVGALPQAIAGTAGTLRLRINPTGLPAGLTTVNGTLLTSDEDIPGEGDGTLSFSVAITVGGTSPRPGDINLDGAVNGLDLAMLLSQWAGSGSADLNGSGGVDGADLSILLGNWG